MIADESELEPVHMVVVVQTTPTPPTVITRCALAFLTNNIETDDKVFISLPLMGNGSSKKSSGSAARPSTGASFFVVELSIANVYSQGLSFLSLSNVCRTTSAAATA
jgi:hypothetical protein